MLRNTLILQNLRVIFKKKKKMKQSGTYLTESANIYLPDHYDRGKQINRNRLHVENML